MRIGVDCQALQTADSRWRGRGIYTRSVINELVAQRSDEYELFFSGALETAHALRESARNHTIRYEAPIDAPGTTALNEYLQRLAYESFDLDLLHITSPVEGRDAVIMAPAQRRAFPVVCTLFDLIPLVFDDVYLQDSEESTRYRERIQWYREADVVVAISEHSRRDAIKLLGIPEDRIVNVGAAADPFFRRLDSRERVAACDATKAELGIRSRCVLFTGGFDFRKNMDGMINAFSLLPDNVRGAYQLVIVCALSGDQAATLRSRAREYDLADSLILTNYITQQSLLHLYNCCDLFVFPSLYEGFGLPVLEAMSCGAPVIGSATSSIPEVIGDAGILVDPSDPKAIAHAMDTVLRSEDLKTELREKSLQRARRFTWDATARATRDAYSLARAHWKASVSFLRAHKPKLALFSPLPPTRSGISDYSTELLPHLATRFEIDAYVDGFAPSLLLEGATRYFSSDAHLKDRAYFSFLFQMGNSVFHAYMIDVLLKHAGITVLHDVSLHDLVYWTLTQRRRSPERYAEELTYEGGVEAQIALEMLQVGELSQKQLMELFPMNERILSASKAVIVHSEFARNEITRGRSRQAAERVRHINEGMSIPELPSAQDKMAIRRGLGLPESAFIVGTFGIMSEPKELEVGLHAFAQLLAERDTYYVGIGRFLSNEYERSITGLIEELGITQRVDFKGHVSFRDYYAYLFACDAVLNLRYPSRGETSATMLRAMSCALPTVVNNVAAFRELPDDVAIKVNLGPPHTDEVAAALRLLASDEQLRGRLGDAARQHIFDHHSWEKIAEHYADFIEQVEMTGLGDQAAVRELIARLVTNARTHNTNGRRQLDQAMEALASSEGIGRVLWV